MSVPSTPNLQQRCRSFWRSDWAALLMLAILTSLTFCRVLWADFLSYDDPFYVTNNTLVQSGVSATSLARAWTTFECANWHPGTWMSLMLDYQIYGLRSWGFHLTNLILHVANTLVLFVLLRRLRLERGPAWFVAAVFAVHPLHVESVAWVTERKDVLATLFGLLAILAYVQSIETGGRRHRVLSYVWFFLSLISKPLLVTLPCLLLVLDYGPLRRENESLPNPDAISAHGTIRWEGVRRFISLALEKWPFWLLSIGSSIVTVVAQQRGGAVATFERFGLAERGANVCVSYCAYLHKSLWPTHLAVYYPYSMHRWDWGWVVAGAVLLMVITILAWQLRHRCSAILVGWLWFLGTLVPMIGLVQVGSQAMADRYMYFPLVGLSWAATAAVLMVWPPSPSSRRLQTVFGTGLVAAMCVLTWQQTAVWRNTLVLSQHALQVTPNNYVAHEMHARALRIAGLTDHAIAEYRRAISINPTYFSARNDLGLLLVQRDDLADAAEQFRLGLKTVPHHSRLRWNLAKTLTKQQKFDEADAEFQLAERDAPHNDALVLDHARALQEAGRFPAALQRYEQAVALAPQSLVNQLELAVTLSRAPAGQGRDLSRSIRLLEELCRQTDAPRAWVTLAEVRTDAGDGEAAEIAWKRAIQRADHLNRPDLADLARASRQRKSEH